MLLPACTISEAETTTALSKSAKRKQRLFNRLKTEVEVIMATPMKERSGCVVSFACPQMDLGDLQELVEKVINTENNECTRTEALRKINDAVKATEDYIQRLCLRRFLSEWGLRSVSCEAGVDAGAFSDELREYRMAEKSDDLTGDANSTRSAIELFRNVMDKHRQRRDVLMDVLEAILSLDDGALERLPGLLRDLNSGKNSTQLPSPTPSDPEQPDINQNSLRLETTAPMTAVPRRPRSQSRGRSSAVQRPKLSDDLLSKSENNQHSYSLVLKAPSTPAPISGGPPAPPPPPPLSRSSAPPPAPPPPPPGLLSCRSSTAPPAPPPPPASLLSPAKIPTISISGPPPPAPPPPPLGLLTPRSGGPPPAPPLHLSPGLTPKPVKSEEFYPKSKKTAPIRWTKINDQKIHDVSTVWNDYNRPDFPPEERSALETMFEVAETSVRQLPSKKKNEPEKVTGPHLDSKRTLQLEILLAKFKMNISNLVAKIESDKEGVFQVDSLQSLLNAYPTPEEVEPFRTLETVPSSKPEHLCYEVARRPLLKLRIELMVARETVPSELAQHLLTCEKLKAACNTLRGKVVLNLLHKCLQCGNFVNQGSTMAHAAGFKLTSLPELLEMRAKNSAAQYPRFIDFLVKNLSITENEAESIVTSLATFSKCSIDELQTAQEQITKTLAKLKAMLDTAADPNLRENYCGFIERSEKDVTNLLENVDYLRIAERDLLAYFCAEKTDTLVSLAGVLSKAFKIIGETLKSNKSNLTRSQSFHCLARPSTSVENSLRSLRRDDSFRLSLRGKRGEISTREQISSIFLNVANNQH